jgi:hypothetical protein
MEQAWFSAGLWLMLALATTLPSIWFKISTALSEIVVGTVAQRIIGALVGADVPGARSAWIGLRAETGAIVLNFLAGAELDPQIFRVQWKEASVVGMAGFAGSSRDCAVARFVLNWPTRRVCMRTSLSVTNTGRRGERANTSAPDSRPTAMIWNGVYCGTQRNFPAGRRALLSCTPRSQIGSLPCAANTGENGLLDVAAPG